MRGSRYNCMRVHCMRGCTLREGFCTGTRRGKYKNEEDVGEVWREGKEDGGQNRIE